MNFVPKSRHLLAGILAVWFSRVHRQGIGGVSIETIILNKVPEDAQVQWRERLAGRLCYSPYGVAA
jgi:hypothetical protein